MSKTNDHQYVLVAMWVFNYTIVQYWTGGTGQSVFNMYSHNVTCTHRLLRLVCQEFLCQRQQVLKPVYVLYQEARLYWRLMRIWDKYWSNSALMQLPLSVIDTSAADM